MTWNMRFRRLHRWFAIAFTLGFIVNVVAMAGGGQPPFWVYGLVLGPLFLLLPTGLTLLAMSHLARRRGAAR